MLLNLTSLFCNVNGKNRRIQKRLAFFGVMGYSTTMDQTPIASAATTARRFADAVELSGKRNEDLADAVDVEPSTIYRWKREGAPEVAQTYARAGMLVGLTPSRLLLKEPDNSDEPCDARDREDIAAISALIRNLQTRNPGPRRTARMVRAMLEGWWTDCKDLPPEEQELIAVDITRGGAVQTFKPIMKPPPKKGDESDGGAGDQMAGEDPGEYGGKKPKPKK